MVNNLDACFINLIIFTENKQLEVFYEITQ